MLPFYGNFVRIRKGYEFAFSCRLKPFFHIEIKAYGNYINVLLIAIQNDKMFAGGSDMATKTANVMARVAPDVKFQAEAIMEQLGIPASVVINSLYKQIIMTKSIPFSISIPQYPIALDEMDKDTFNAMMEEGYRDVVEGRTKPLDEAFEEIRKTRKK